MLADDAIGRAQFHRAFAVHRDPPCAGIKADQIDRIAMRILETQLLLATLDRGRPLPDRLHSGGFRGQAQLLQRIGDRLVIVISSRVADVQKHVHHS